MRHTLKIALFTLLGGLALIATITDVAAEEPVAEPLLSSDILGPEAEESRSRLMSLVRDFVPQGNLDGVRYQFGQDPALTFTAERLRWRWQPDLQGSDGRVIVDVDGIEGPGGFIDISFAIAIRQRDDGWAVDVDIESVSCAELLAMLPRDWLDPFGSIEMDGEVSPWIEARLHNGRRPIWSIRQSGFADCGVSDVESIPGGSWLPTEDLSALNGPFAVTVGSGDQIAVGPATENYVETDELPDHVTAAIYLSEDPTFFEHGGFDPQLIAMAMQRNLQSERVIAGGSSITQQLVKNLFLSREKTLKRKVQELILAMSIAETVAPDRILEIYVNVIEFGDDIYGISAAARHYFDKEPTELDALESSFLAAIKPYPGVGEVARRTGDLRSLPATMEFILDSLHRSGYISEEERNRHSPEDLRFSGDD